jgi:hypothetical protein
MRPSPWVCAWTLSAACLGLAGGAKAQVKGPTTCFKCHKTMAKPVWETDAAFHKKAVEQLAGPKAAAFAAAVGLASPTTVTGKPHDSVSCHATVVGGSPSVGVSCESCHGAAGGYFTPHQEPEFYNQPESQWLGLRNMYKKPAAIAAMCVSCHVTVDPRLKKAGHPVGEAFDAGKGLSKMVHWDSGVSTNRKRDGYNAAFYAQVSAESPKLVAKRLSSAGPSLAAAAPAPPPPSSGKPAAPARPAAAAKADPFDWDQPVAALPADYPGDSAPAITAKAAAPAPGRPRPQRALAPSTAAEVPITPEEPTQKAPPPLAPAATKPPAARAAELRGRSASVLASLLKSKHTGQLDIPPAAPPAEFQGPDGELLRLQDEVLYLALETLRKRPEEKK